MKLAYWMYAGPAHIGTLRVASSFKNVHAIMHAPLGDDYFNVMRSMLERERDFTPVTASIVDRHVLARGSQEKVVENIQRKDKEENPDLILLTPTCTSSILQEDLQNFVNRASNESNSDVLLADVNHYRVNELQAADRTLEQIVRFYVEKAKKDESLNQNKTEKPSANIIGMFTLGFHNQHDCKELKRLLNDLGISINEIIPEGSFVTQLKNLPKAWLNIVPYREVGLMTATYLEKEYNMPYTSITPMGIIDTSSFIREIASICHTIYPQIKNIQNNKNIQNSNKINEEIKDLKPTSTSTSTSTSIQNSNKINEEIKDLKPTSTSTSTSTSIQNDDKINKEMKAREDGNKNNEEMKEDVNKYEEMKEDVNKYEEMRDLTIMNKKDYESYIDKQTTFVSQAAWFSRSIDCQNLTGKKTVVFGDATHAASMTKILVREMGINVVCAGTYCKHDADWFREEVSGFCDKVLITDDHSQIGDIISQIEPAAIFGTQMERHVGKRLDIPCGVISAPVHIQNFPLGYRPFLGYEGTNQISDLVYNSFGLGMEDHLLEIFNGHDNKEVITRSYSSENELQWNKEASAELSRVPGFVRGKVKRNTEKYARSQNSPIITLEVMYAAKEAVAV